MARHTSTSELQRGVVGLLMREGECDRRGLRLDQGCAGAADAIELAGPERLARHRVEVRVEQRELDARGAAVENQNRIVHEASSNTVVVGTRTNRWVAKSATSH